MPISIKKLLLSLSNQWKSRRSIDSFLQIATRALLVTALFNSQFVSFPILVTVQGFQKHAKSFSLTLFVLANYHLDFTVSNIYQRPHSTNFQVVFTLKTTFSYSQLSCMAPRTERLISFFKVFSCFVNPPLFCFRNCSNRILSRSSSIMVRIKITCSPNH